MTFPCTYQSHTVNFLRQRELTGQEAAPRDWHWCPRSDACGQSEFMTHVPTPLITEIHAGNCVAFVGAGFPATVIPPWGKLLSELVRSSTTDIQNHVTSQGPQRFRARPGRNRAGAARPSRRRRLPRSACRPPHQARRATDVAAPRLAARHPVVGLSSPPTSIHSLPAARLDLTPTAAYFAPRLTAGGIQATGVTRREPSP